MVDTTDAPAGSAHDSIHQHPTEQPTPDQRFAASLTAVGGRLRELRKAAGMSLRVLAARSGLSASFLSLVERGECSLSVTSLFAISAALDIDPATVLNSTIDEGPAPAACGLWRGVDAATVHTTIGEREYFPFTPQLPDQTMAPIYFRIRPTSVIAPPAVHTGEEIAYVCSGELFIRLGDQELNLRSGEGVHFSSDIPHSIANKTDEVVEAVWVTAAVPTPRRAEPS